MNYHKVYMNHIYSSSLLTELAHMWKTQSLCDAVIKAGNSSTKAHRLVLVAACPMLKSMDCASVGSHLEVQLASDIKPESVHTFLQYLYEGFMMLTEENYKEVEKIGRVLQVDSVVKCCADFHEALHANSEYRYSYQDHVEFKHVRQTDMLKVQEKRHSKRKPDVVRRFNTEVKKPKVDAHFSQSGCSSTDVSSLSSKSDDQIFMSHSYNDRSGTSNLQRFVPVSLIRTPESQLKVIDSNSVRVSHDGVMISNRNNDKFGANVQCVNSSPAMQLSVANEIQENSPIQIIDADSGLSSEPMAESDSSPNLPTRPNLIGPFVQGVASQSNVFYTNSTPLKGDYQVSLLNKGNNPAASKSSNFITNQRAKPRMGPKSKVKAREVKSYISEVVKNESVGVAELNDESVEEGLVQIGVTRGSDDSSIRDDMEIEEPPPDDVRVTADQGGVWYEGKTHDDADASSESSFTDRKAFQGKGDSGMSLKGLVNEGKGAQSLEMELLPGHKLIRIEGCKKACAFCDIHRVKTKSGWQIKSYFKCEACDVPLCKSSKECFKRYHELRLEQPGVSPKELQKQMKAQTKPMLIHNIVGGANDLQSYIDMAPPLASISPTSSASSPLPTVFPTTFANSDNSCQEDSIVSATPSSIKKSLPNDRNTTPPRKAPPLIAMGKPKAAQKTTEGGDTDLGIVIDTEDNSDVPSLNPASNVPSASDTRPSDIVIQ